MPSIPKRTRSGLLNRAISRTASTHKSKSRTRFSKHATHHVALHLGNSWPSYTSVYKPKFNWISTLPPSGQKLTELDERGTKPEQPVLQQLRYLRPFSTFFRHVLHLLNAMPSNAVVGLASCSLGSRHRRTTMTFLCCLVDPHYPVHTPWIWTPSRSSTRTFSRRRLQQPSQEIVAVSLACVLYT